MNFDLAKKTILLTLSGSRAYGFANPTSDWDYRGICIPPLDTYVGISSKFEQIVDASNKHVWKHYPDGLVQPESDMQVMELSKFCSLAADCNPSIIEILFSAEDSIVHRHPIVDKLLANREIFLSRRAKPRFCGYALSQLKRIKRHKRWLDDPPIVEPTRKAFGLPESGLISADQVGAAEALIKHEVDSFVIDQNDLSESTKIELVNSLGRMMRAVWVAMHPSDSYPVGDNQKFESTESALAEFVMRKEGFSENFIETLKKEKQYRAVRQEWESYQRWLKERNPARAELEKKFGYDTKHACHLVRLIRMCREILETGQVNVKRPDAEELREIRAGAWTYTRVCEFAEAEDIDLVDVVKKSKLPASPDMQSIQKIVFDMIMDFNQG